MPLDKSTQKYFDEIPDEEMTDEDKEASKVLAARPDPKIGWREKVARSWPGQRMTELSNLVLGGIKAFLPIKFEEDGVKPTGVGAPPILEADMDLGRALGDVFDYVNHYEPGNEAENRKSWEHLKTRNPTLIGMLDNFRTALGTPAMAKLLTGKDSSKEWEKTKKAWQDAPIEQVLEVLPAIKRIAIVNDMKKTIEIIEKIEKIEGAGGELIGASFKEAASRFARDPDLYDPDVISEYGESPTGETLKTEKKATELADEIGAGVDKTPMGALTTSEFAGHVEETGRNIEQGGKIEQRFVDTATAIENKHASMLEDLSNKAIDAPDNIKNPEVAGNQFLEDYEANMKGDYTVIGDKLEADKQIMRQPIRTVPASAREIFPNTFALIEELIAEDSGVRGNLGDKQLEKIISDVEELIEGFKKKSEITGVTLKDPKQLRTSFNKNMDVFKRKGEITKLGSKSPAGKFNRSLFQDFYDLLEKEVVANPADFPENFDSVVKLHNKEYAILMDLDETEAAKFLRRTQKKPVAILNKLLSKDPLITTEFIDDIKELGGEGGWERLRVGLLNRILEKSLSRTTKDITDVGLKNMLNTIMENDKNRLVQLFGEDTAKVLVEMGNFSQMVFQKKGKWNTPYAKFVTTLLESPKFFDVAASLSIVGPEMAQAIDAVARSSGYKMDMGAAQVLIAGGIWMGTKTARWGLMSDLGRKWMLEGISFQKTVLGKEVTIDGKTLYQVGEFMQEHSYKIGTTARRIAKAKGDSDAVKEYLQKQTIGNRYDSVIAK